jgi:hypothetical protein
MRAIIDFCNATLRSRLCKILSIVLNFHDLKVALRKKGTPQYMTPKNTN